MSSKVLCIITSIVLILAFFMPWIKYYGFGGSPFDLIIELSKNLKYLKEEPSILFAYIVLIFPICGLTILIISLQPSKEPSFVLEGLKKTPLLLLIAITIYGLVKIGDSAKYIADANILKVLGAGLYLTIISSFILFFHPTNPPIVNEKKLGSMKEKANNEDLFK